MQSINNSKRIQNKESDKIHEHKKGNKGGYNKGKVEIRYVEASSLGETLAPLVIKTHNKKQALVSPASLSDFEVPMLSVETPLSPTYSSDNASSPTNSDNLSVPKSQRKRIYTRNQILRVRKNMSRSE